MSTKPVMLQRIHGLRVSQQRSRDGTGVTANMIKRAGILLFSILAGGLGPATIFDVYLHGHLTLFGPLFLAGFTIIGVGLLFSGIISTRDRANDLEERTGRLTQLIEELETFIESAEAANKRLKASEARYTSLVDAQAEIIMRRTPDGRLTYANEAFFKSFGADDIIGQMFKPDLHPESPTAADGRMVGRELGRERVSYDQLVMTAAGHRWIAWEDYAIRDGDGKMVEIQTVGHDITERKALEAAHSEARDKAEEANRAKSRFLATMSHEIRTPMNGVLGMARLLLETPLAPDQKTYAEAIRQSGLSLMALIEDVLDFSKIESGALTIEKGEVALRPLIEGVAELLSTRAHAKDIEIATAIAADVPHIVKLDGIRLRQVLTNLVGNAIKFTEQGGVLVSAAVERPFAASTQATLRISVRDTGVGVPEDKQAHIFQDFVQADSSHARRFEGTGLGLSISKRLVEAMHGEIGVRAAEGNGSVFWVTIPLDDTKAIAVDAPLHGKQVALVSDSPILREGLTLQLGAAGAKILQTSSFAEFDRERRKTDVLLIDASKDEVQAFPDMSAFEFPAVALLMPGQRAQLAALSGKGYRAYLMKPVRQDSLEKRLAAAMAGEVELEIETEAPKADHPAKRGLSILLAEDNPVNALLARELLRRRGHTVREVTTGEEAVKACANSRFDLVIMDVHMPGLDGIEATKRIRIAESQKKGTARLPIFALTADALDTGRNACIKAGMDGFLTKPIDPAELDAMLVGVNPPVIVAAE